MDFNEVVPALLARVEALEKKLAALERKAAAPTEAPAPSRKK